MVINGYQWLSLIGYVWLCKFMHGYVWLSLVMYGYQWLCVIIFGCNGDICSEMEIMILVR